MPWQVIVCQGTTRAPVRKGRMAEVGVFVWVGVDAHGCNCGCTACGMGAVRMPMQQGMELAVALKGVEDWCCSQGDRQRYHAPCTQGTGISASGSSFCAAFMEGCSIRRKQKWKLPSFAPGQHCCKTGGQCRVRHTSWKCQCGPGANKAINKACCLLMSSLGWPL